MRTVNIPIRTLKTASLAVEGQQAGWVKVNKEGMLMEWQTVLKHIMISYSSTQDKMSLCYR